jgi:hypothetical protein
MKSPHYKILEHTKSEFAVLINPAAFKFRMFSGKPHERAVLALNVNYSWLGVAIGHVRSEGNSRLITLSDKSNIRPCICIDYKGFASIKKPNQQDFNLEQYSLVGQAGPTLVWDRKIVAIESAVSESFRSDAIRKTAHIALGCTGAGKVIAAYVNNISIQDLGYYMQQKGAVTAMKCDGGNASALWFNDETLHYKFGPNGSCKAGLQFIGR